MSGSSKMEANNSTVGMQNINSTVHVAGNVVVYAKPSKQTNTDQFQLPRLIDTFRGRNQELKQLESLFFAENVKRVVISGLPGMGKSELAKQFAAYCKEDGKVDHVFWIKAETLTERRDNFETLSEPYKNNGRDKHNSYNKAENLEKSKHNVEKIQNMLRNLYTNYKNLKCLYVFDNTFDRQSIYEIEPPVNDNYLLLTSQAKSWDDVKSLELNQLETNFSIEVFQIILKNLYNKNYYKLYLEIANIVNNIPLGLQVIAAYVRQRMERTGQHFDLQEYVEEIKTNQDEYIAKTIPTNMPNTYKKSLYGAIQISLNKLEEEENLLALNVLFICAFLNPENITLDNLIKIPNIQRLLTQYKNCENKLREALSLIANYSLIRFNLDGHQIEIHRLIQEILRRHLREYDTDTQSICYRSCLEALINYYNSGLYYNHSIILKYADSNVATFYNFCQNNRKELFLNRYSKIIHYILSSLIEWNCIESLKKLLDDIISRNIFNMFMCFSQHLCISAYTCKTISCFDLLEDAIDYNNIDVMKLLVLEYYFDVNSKNSLKETPLHTATENWNLDAISFLVENRADVNLRNWEGEIPLFVFFKHAHLSKHRNLDDVRKILDLLEFEKHKHTRNEDGENLLHAAAYSNNLDLMKLLVLQYDFDINCKNTRNETPLYTAAANWNFEAITFFIESNADVNIKNEYGETPLYIFFKGAYHNTKYYNHTNLDDVKNILEQFNFKEHILTRNDYGQTMLHTVIENNNLNLMKLLVLDYDFDVNYRNTSQATPLHTAASRWNFEAITFLIKRKADVNLRNYNDETPLFHFISGAWRNQHFKMENLNEILNTLNFKQNQHHRNQFGQTLLHAAAESCNANMVTLLATSFELDVNAPDELSSATPLHYLIETVAWLCPTEDNVIRTIQALKNCGARLDITDREGMTPQQLAQQLKNTKYLVPYLIDSETALEY